MNCLVCNKETNNPKFCSRSCSATFINKILPKRKPTRKCIWCDDIVMSSRHSRCKECQEKYLKTRREHIEQLTLAEARRDHWPIKNKFDYIRVNTRYHFKDLAAKPCYICGYDKHVELCHIRPIVDFPDDAKIKEINCYGNIIPLCRNHHWELDHEMIDRSLIDEYINNIKLTNLDSN